MAGTNCGKLDLSSLPLDEILVDPSNQRAWIKAEVEEKIIIWNNRPHIVIKFSDKCAATICNDQQDLNPSLASVNNSSITSKKDVSDGVDNPGCGSFEHKAINIDLTINNSNQSLRTAQSAADATSINDKGYAGPAVMPAAAMIPMRSNTSTYGPYASSNFGSSAGGTVVEVNTDLAPWVFGSSQAMNFAGSSFVENMAIGLVKAESGSMTILGLPRPEFTGLGLVTGQGLNLSGMNFSFGANGISTSYDFRTFTPKFGSLNRHLLDRVKSIAKNRFAQIKFLRNNQIIQNKISRKLKSTSRSKENNKNQPNATKAASLHRVLVAEMYDWQFSDNDGSYSQRTIVGTESLSKSVIEMSEEYNKKAYMSLDGIFSPVSKSGSGGLPRYAIPKEGAYTTGPVGAQPPYSKEDDEDEKSMKEYRLDIQNKYLDPLNNNFEADEHHHDGAGDGHVVDVVGRESEVPAGGIITNFYKTDDENRYSDDYRFLGIKGPIILHSWGYDIDGKPVPNEADPESSAKGGDFTNTNLKDSFLKNWLQKPATWPAAPIDLRFDRKRGVWVSPPAHRIVRARLNEKISPNSSGMAKIYFDGFQAYDSDGEWTTTGTIYIKEQLGNAYASGSYVYVYYDTINNSYHILSVGDSPNCDSEQEDSEFVLNIGHMDLTKVAGWDRNSTQVLAHGSGGCLTWISTTGCSG